MSEYVEREALLKKAIDEKRFVFRMEDLLHEEVVFRTVYKDLAEFIMSIPAADVAPVVHAQWRYRNSPWGGKEMFCTNCKNIPRFPQRKTKCCPNCGARMDGKGE